MNNSQFSSVVEKYNIRANVWQTLPELNFARSNASGVVLGSDYLYVFGGMIEKQGQENCILIEKLNLKNNFGQTKFQIVEVVVPCDLPVKPICEMGVMGISEYEAVIFGGYCPESQQALDTCLKLNVCDGAQETLQVLTSEGEETKEQSLDRPDFFNSSTALTIEEGERVAIFGQFGSHMFNLKMQQFEKFLSYKV